MKTIALILVVSLLAGCASFVKTAGSPHLTATCTAVDTASTYLAIKSGAVETNPMMASLLSHGWAPFLVFQVGFAWFIYKVHEEYQEQIEPALVMVNVIKCGVAANNLQYVK